MPMVKQHTKAQTHSESHQAHSRFDSLEVLKQPENWANILDTYLLQPINGGDGRVLIQVDEYKSRYECIECNGRGHLGVVCKYCKGTKFERGNEENGYCRDCTVGDSKTGIGKTLGFEPCPTCKGKGGTIEIPDENKVKTTMGKILAVSEDGIKCVKVDDSVQFTNYTGTEYEFMGIKLMVCHEKDLLCRVKGLKKTVGQITEVNRAELENTGVPLE